VQRKWIDGFRGHPTPERKSKANVWPLYPSSLLNTEAPGERDDTASENAGVPNERQSDLPGSPGLGSMRAPRIDAAPTLDCAISDWG